LKLAWNRISTGLNHQHKRYFRHLYAPYAIALEDNVADLSQRLRHGSYEPQKPTRVFLPKASGLQRPLTLLCIEDQIVLQGIANVFARRLLARRRQVELKNVYSNILSASEQSIFFLRDWHETYEAFTRKIRYFFRQGLRWIAEFDLAAYYDTIAHDLLLKTAFPKGGLGEMTPVLLSWLKTWSAETTSASHGHGIPQGPIASDFLGECFWLPIDEVLAKKHTYVRYVDDVRLFGRSEADVRRAAIDLEVRCRDRGLIPQAKKFEIRQLTSVADVLRLVPSLGFAGERSEDEPPVIPARTAVTEFRLSLSGRPRRISDKTRARFVLYRAAPSRRLLSYVLGLLPHQPEHIDAFMFYLGRFAREERAVAVCRRVVVDSPYDYVKGEAWQVLARMMTVQEMRGLVDEAVVAARASASGFSLRWGACAFLCAGEMRGLGNLSKWVRFQKSSVLQALLAPILPRDRFRQDDVVAQLLRRSAIEPGLALADRLVRERLSLTALGVRPETLPLPVQRVYKAIGIVGRPAGRSEPVADLLERSLGVAQWRGWRGLLAGEYGHACRLLAQAVPVFESGRSVWLIHQNSFDHAVFLALQEWLRMSGLPGTVTLRASNGDLLSLGVLLDRQNGFSRTRAAIADVFRDVNGRRNTVPQAHPYATKGGRRTVPLRAAEQRAFVPRLRAAFQEIARLVG
jgi:hypothetical protein